MSLCYRGGVFFIQNKISSVANITNMQEYELIINIKDVNITAFDIHFEDICRVIAHIPTCKSPGSRKQKAVFHSVKDGLLQPNTWLFAS